MLDAFKVNGTATTDIWISGCREDNLVFDIQTHKYATVKAVLITQQYYRCYEDKHNNKVITLQNGNNIELVRDNVIQIKPNSG